MFRPHLAVIAPIVFLIGGIGAATAQTPPSKQPPPAVTEQPKTPPKAPSTAEKPPLPGANSFTEGQARQRMQDAGFTDVSGLAKDQEGIWRGTAKYAGKQVKVALDFQGNVVAAE
jgi:hypothetical protein